MNDTVATVMRKMREKHLRDNPDCPYGDQPHFVPPGFGMAGFYACQPPKRRTQEEVEAEVAMFNRDRCACGGSPAWVDPRFQTHRADCEVHRRREPCGCNGTPHFLTDRCPLPPPRYVPEPDGYDG